MRTMKKSILYTILLLSTISLFSQKTAWKGYDALLSFEDCKIMKESDVPNTLVYQKELIRFNEQGVCTDRKFRFYFIGFK